MNTNHMNTTTTTNFRPANDYDEQVARMLVFTETGYQSTNVQKGKRNLSDFIGSASNDNG